MQWYFYVQMEVREDCSNIPLQCSDCVLQGSSAECEKFETKVSVCKYPNSDRHSITYHGKVCPIDFKGADDLDSVGCGLNVRDACMEKIFLVDSSSGEGGACRTEAGDNK